MPPRRRKRIDPAAFRLPVDEIKSGVYTDAYFPRAREVLRQEKRSPAVVMQFTGKDEGWVSGVDEAIALFKLCADDWSALTVQALRKEMHNLYAQTYFTWAKDIYDLDAGESPEDAGNRARERALYPEQPNFRFCSTTIYQFPIGRGRRFLGHGNWLINGLLGGWRLSTIFVLESGRPLTAMWSGPDPTGTRYSGSSTRPTVTLRPDVLRNPNLDNPTQYGWFDVKAFAAPPLGSFGSAAKGVIIGPAPITFSNALAKEFPLKERARLQFELLVPNTFNHPNWAAPQTNITNATAGLVTAISGQVRWVQVQGRLEW